MYYAQNTIAVAVIFTVLLGGLIAAVIAGPNR